MTTLPQDSAPNLFDGKTCSICGVWKLLERFPSRPGRQDYKCRDCYNKHGREWELAHKEHVAKRKLAYARRTRDKQKASRERRREKLQQSKREDYMRNKEARMKTVLEYRRNHPEMVTMIAENYRARKLAAEGSFTAKEWRDILARYGHKCVACGASGTLDADHVIPLSKGGTNLASNLQPLCRSCNAKKGVKIIDYR